MAIVDIGSSSTFLIASFMGSVAFALSGWLIGVRKEMDVMGLFIMSMLTANGGGLLRDVLAGRPPSLFTDITGFYLVCSVSVLAFLLRFHKYAGIERHLFFVLSDSIGLVAFSITGAMIGLEVGFNFFGVIVLAFLTATGGGIIRDMMMNEVPVLLSSGFYASVAVLIAIALVLLERTGYLSDITVLVVAILGLTVRLVAHFFNWHLPSIKRGTPYRDV